MSAHTHDSTEKARLGRPGKRGGPGPRVLAIGLLSLASAAASADIVIRPAALTGQPAPGTEPGVRFSALTTPINHTIMRPRIDEQGNVAFIAFLEGPGVTGSNVQGIWAEQSGTLQLVVRTGEPAPDVEGGTFFGVPSTEVPDPPSFGAGMAGFHGVLTGAGIDLSDNDGLWVGPPGDVSLVVREGDAAPGLASTTFGAPFGRVNGAGRLALQARLRVDGGSTQSLWTNRNGAVELIAREGDPAPGTEAGTVFANGQLTVHAGVVKTFAFNDNSEFALVTGLAGPDVEQDTDEALFVERNGQLQLLLRENDPAPGSLGHRVFFGGGVLGIRTVSLNNNGHVAFLADVEGRLISTPMFTDRTGELEVVAVPDDPAPGTGQTFNFLRSPLLNDNERIAFTAALPDDDGDIFTPPPQAVFSDVEGSLTAVAQTADLTAEGDVLIDPRLLALNNAGQMLLEAELQAETFTRALVLRDSDGALHRIAATHEFFSITDDDTRRIIRVVSGGMNNAGQVVFRLDFDDGSSGHFVASVGEALPGDIDGDGDVDLDDLTLLLQDFGCETGTCAADVDGDGDTDLDDLTVLLQNFGG